MEEERLIKVRVKGHYAGHNIKASGVINLDFNFDYSELADIIPLVQLLNNNIELVVRLERKTYKLGEFMLNQVKIKSDGSSFVRFNAIIDNINANALNLFSGEEVQLQASGKVYIEGDDDE